MPDARGKNHRAGEAPGGFIPGQWYKLTITSSVQNGVQVAIDNQVRIPFVPDVSRGGIGLYTESTSAPYSTTSPSSAAA